MTVDLTKQQLDQLKMWPDVSGTVTPLFMIKNSQKRLNGFRPYDNLRPVREWYEDGTVHWADDLGEVPDDLDAYFRSSEGAGKKRRPVSPFEIPAQKPAENNAEVPAPGDEESALEESETLTNGEQKPETTEESE